MATEQTLVEGRLAALDAVAAAEREALAAVAAGASLEESLTVLVRAVEVASNEEVLGSVLLLDERERRLRHGAAPSLPEPYNRAIDGIAIGPTVGSCGTAAFGGHPVFVMDIATDPLWADFKDLALAHGLRACWSTPIRSGAGPILGTFALYHRVPTVPGAHDRLLVDRLAPVAAHVIEASVRRDGG
jgi:GAF domain-containing protein